MSRGLGDVYKRQMLTVSSVIDPLGGEMVRQDRSVPVVTGNTFIKE